MEVPYIYKKQAASDGLIHRRRDDLSWWLVLCGLDLTAPHPKGDDEVATCLSCLALVK